MIVRFAWVDRADASASDPMTVTWARFDDGRVVRRSCQGGTFVDAPLGEHVAAVSVTCLPAKVCDAAATDIQLSLTGSAAKTATTVTLSASLRPEPSGSLASGASGPPSPLVVVGAGCPEIVLGGQRTVVLGDTLYEGECGDSAIKGDLARLESTGVRTAVTGLRDPLADAIPEPVGCPGHPTRPRARRCSPTR